MLNGTTGELLKLNGIPLKLNSTDGQIEIKGTSVSFGGLLKHLQDMISMKVGSAFKEAKKQVCLPKPQYI